MRVDIRRNLGRVDEALDDLRTAVALDPGFWVGWLDLAMVHASRGQHNEALQYAEKASAGAPSSAVARGVITAALANCGETGRAESLLAALRGDVQAGAVGLLWYSLGRGDVDAAAEWARRAAEQRYPALIPRVIRAYEPVLRQSAAWPDVLKTMNLG